MKRCIGMAALVLALVLTAGASSAQAAKGAKKNAEHKIHGKVVAMHQGKHGLTMTVKVHHHHKKKAQQPAAAQAAAAAPGAPKHHRSHKTFQVTNNTQVEAVRGKQRQPTSVAALHKGAQVTVTAKGYHADKVAVHHKKNSSTLTTPTATPTSNKKKPSKPKKP